MAKRKLVGLTAALIGGWALWRLRTRRPTVLRNSVAVITGASSGIGRATAHALAAEGLHLALVARTEADLRRVQDELLPYGVQTRVLPADVTDDEQSQAAVDQVLRDFGRIDVLINSAGLFIGGALEAADPQAIRGQIAVNLYGSIRMTQCVLPVMLRQRRGHIVGISSLAGRIPAPGEAVYSATKAGQIAFGDALRRELAGTGVRVTSILPSWTDTPMIENLDQDTMQRAGFLTPLLSIEQPEDVASAIVDALRFPRPTVLPRALQPQVGYLLSGIAPRLIDHYFGLFFRREEALPALEDLSG